jgi:hypothetical protein
MTPDERAEILAHDTDFMTASIRKAVRMAIEEHYRAGNPIVIWRDGEKVTVPPEDIPALLLKVYGYDVTGHAPADAEQADGSIPARNR